MLVRLTTNLGYNDYPFVLQRDSEDTWLEGDEREVPDSIGRKMLARRHAVLVERPAAEPMAMQADQDEQPALDKFEAMREENINPPNRKASGGKLTAKLKG